MEGEAELVFFWVGKADSTPGEDEPISPDELDEYQSQVLLDGYDNVIFTDGDVETSNGAHVWDSFESNNPDLTYGGGIPVVFTKHMVIGSMAGTYDWATYPLDDIQGFLQE